MKTRRYGQEELAFGKGLRILMEREELNISEVADWSGVEKQTIREICRSSRRPYEGTKRMIAAVFRMTVEEVEAVGWSSEAAEAEG